MPHDGTLARPLVFAPLAWLKLQYLCHAGPTEVAGFGLSHPDDPLYLEDVFTGEQHTLERLNAQKVAALSGIAQPESFENSLLRLGAQLVYSKRFADHHRFTQQEVLNAVNRGKKRQATAIITTQKDAVRFPKIDRRDLPIYFMRVEIKIVTGAKDFHDCVRQICFR